MCCQLTLTLSDLYVRTERFERPGYGWATSGQSPEVQLFFPAMALETGAAFTNRGKPCGHLDIGNRSDPRTRVLADS